jgi:hypothetical protein
MFVNTTTYSEHVHRHHARQGLEEIGLADAASGTRTVGRFGRNPE